MGKRHRVQPGDCLSSIGEQYGFFPGTLWDHPENAQLKNLRKNPNVLMAGVDEVFIPDKQPKEVPCGTSKRHTFRRLGVPELFRLTLLSNDNSPRKHLPFRLVLQGSNVGASHPGAAPRVMRGHTNEDGALEAWIPPGILSGELVLNPGENEEIHVLSFGHLPPVDEATGVFSRLQNLGYHAGETGENGALAAALRAFQKDEGLAETGEPDGATLSALVLRHRS